MFTDTHCHVIPLEYDNYLDILNNLKDNNIQSIIINGYNLESNKQVVDICSKYKNVYGALGLHPDNINENINECLNYIKSHLNDKNIIAVGEIGLDYYHNKENKTNQLNLFNTLLKIASDVNKPVIIHSREATEDTISTIKKYSIKGVIHSFTGSLETANIYIKQGYKLGINGVLTFKNSKLSDTLKKIDISNILLETDSPYLTPVPYRGQKNEPKHINDIAEYICQIYGVNKSTLSNILNQNLKDIFDI